MCVSIRLELHVQWLCALLFGYKGHELPKFLQDFLNLRHRT